MTQGELPPEFQALEDRLSELRGRYARRELDDSAYQSEVERLTLRDAAGDDWWLGGEPGAWHRWDGSAWVRSALHVSPPAPAPSVAPPLEKGRRGPARPLLLGCGAGLALVVLAVIVVLAGGWIEYQATPKIVEGIEPGAMELALEPLSADQKAVVDRLGHPEAFSLLFYEEETEDGSLGDVRFETWSYYTSALEYTFINGEQVAEDPLEIDLMGELVVIPYHPEQFVAYMDLDEVIASAGLETYLVVPLEKELVDGGEVYYADELTFGLKDDELLYVEALALETDG
jgi:hypothetical protein